MAAKLSALRHFLRDTVNMEAPEAAQYIREMRKAGINSDEKEAEMLKHLTDKYNVHGGEHLDVNISDEVKNALSAQGIDDIGLGQRIHEAGARESVGISRKDRIKKAWDTDRKYRASWIQQDKEIEAQKALNKGGYSQAIEEQKIINETKAIRESQAYKDRQAVSAHDDKVAREKAEEEARIKERMEKIQSGEVVDAKKTYEEPPAKEPETPRVKPAAAVKDTPVANEPMPGYDGGGGSETPKASGQQAAEEVQKQAEQTVSAKGGASAEEGFSNTGAGSDKDPMEDFFSGKLGQDGLSNADKHKFNRVRDDYRNYNALKGELEEGDVDGLAKLNKEYGIGKGIDPAEHFKQQANGEATTMDWIMGNHVPEIGLGTAMAGGAISACFSNKGKMSNSQLYGESF